MKNILKTILGISTIALTSCATNYDALNYYEVKVNNECEKIDNLSNNQYKKIKKIFPEENFYIDTCKNDTKKLNKKQIIK